MFYLFIQSPLHGFYDKNENVDIYVIVESENENSAIEKLENVGVDFSEYCLCSENCDSRRWYDDFNEVFNSYGEVLEYIVNEHINIDRVKFH